MPPNYTPYWRAVLQSFQIIRQNRSEHFNFSHQIGLILKVTEGVIEYVNPEFDPPDRKISVLELITFCSPYLIILYSGNNAKLGVARCRLAHWMLCCPVGYVEMKGLTYSDRLNRSEKYLLIGFLLVIPSQSVLLLARQSVTQDNCSILVS